MSLAKLSIKRPTFISTILILLMLVGVFSMKNMKVALFPDVSFPIVSVTTIYPGAGPEEIESQVTNTLEEQLSSISGLDELSSISQDGVSIVTTKFTFES